jgi:7-cyano-7-deazaguanine synthase in queuosine biosynthesis
MTRYHFRFEGGVLPSDPDSVLLDWAPRSNSATIDTTKTFLIGWQLPLTARLLLAFGSAVYCVDKLSLRNQSADGWTRELPVEISGHGTEPLQAVAADLEQLLEFLTGDHWALDISPRKSKKAQAAVEVPGDFETVCLFSGGLDSLCGAIDILEQGKSACLLSHHEGGIISGSQTRLAQRLTDHYGVDRVHHEQIWIGPAPPHPDQATQLPPDDREETTRSRSLLFILAGVALASSVGETTPLNIPENGFIGINVPLVGSRLGSLSTRTTHPHFMAALARILKTLGFETPLVNPYRLQTKGEVVTNCSNPSLLKDLAPLSISCAHPQAARWSGLPQGNCGYCFPCLIRRAALFKAGWDSGSAYAFDVLTNPSTLDEQSDRSADFRALLFGLSREPSPLEVFRSGAIPEGEGADFDDVFRRGRDEIREWLQDGASKGIRKGWPRVFS